MPDGSLGFAIPQTPVEVLAEITARCNLRCSYCYHFDSASEHCGDLDTTQWLQFFDELQSLKVFRVTFSGGEPLIREDFMQLCQHVAKNNMAFRLLTNGTLITDEIAAGIAATRRCTYVQVSLDGLAEVNDRFRGKGSFDAAVRGIRLLQKHNVPIFPRITVSKHNLGKLEETISFFANELGIERISTNSVVLTDANNKDADSLELTLHEFADSMREHLAVGKKYPKLIQSTSGPLGAGLRSWSRILKCKREGTKIRNAGFHSTCGYVFSRMCIHADGGIVPCLSYPDQIMGYINQTPLNELWHNGAYINELRSLRRKPLTDYDLCRTCEYRPWCCGSCPVHSIMETTATEKSCASSICLKKFLQAVPDFDFNFDPDDL